MQNRFSIKVHGKAAPDGVISVFARVVSQRKKVEFLICNGPAEKWMPEIAKFKGIPEMNTLIDKIKANITNAFINAEVQGRKLELAELKNIINGVPVRISWFAFIDKQIEASRGLVSNQQIRHYKSAKNKLMAFNKAANWADLDSDFCRAYHVFLKKKYNNHPNTVVKAFGFLRKWANEAVKCGYLEKNVFKDYRVKKIKTVRDRLSFSEVQQLQAVLKMPVPEKVVNVVRWFLFSCYTGLRYNDLRGLKWTNIVDGVIVLNQNKTLEPVKIPLSGLALDLLPDGGSGFVFKMYANQKCNEYLKLAAMYAGIDKNLTFHIARHTFATISLNIGMRLEVVSELLGHQNLKTTKIYALMLDDTLKENMKLWANLSF